MFDPRFKVLRGGVWVQDTGGVGGMLPLIPYFNLIKEKYYIISLNQKNKLISLKKHKKRVLN